jgi:magnesium chelatase family protein
MSAPAVTVEVQAAGGLPAMNIVGLAEMAVRESKDRVRGALHNGRFQIPAGRITVNLAPADLPKEGGRFDLPIALGVLGASGQLRINALPELEFLGELALSGDLRPVQGVLPAALAARNSGRALVLPRENAAEAGLVKGLRIHPAAHLLEVCAHLNGETPLGTYLAENIDPVEALYADLSEVRGQAHAKRALEVAAAGAHSLLFIGPPGTGKSMLASRLPGLLPALSEGEALEVAAIRSVSGMETFDPARWRQRPFRSPHHTASAIALVGGGANPRPGEISLAHLGVLFLDELPEYERRVLEVLREPLESGHIHISRAARQVRFPARFQLVAAMNPCPCGYLGDPGGRCRCTAEQVARYRARISGPLLDRIDLHVEVPRLRPEEMAASLDGLFAGLPRNMEGNQPGDIPGGLPPGVSRGPRTRAGAPAPADGRPDASAAVPAYSPTSDRGDHGAVIPTSAQVRARVEAARERQFSRQGKPNQALEPREIDRHCRLDEVGQRLMTQAMARLGLSPRGYHRVLKVGRTIADLAGSEEIATSHLGEAIGYRRLDRQAPA